MSETRFEVPDSVISYVNSPAIRAAVDELAYVRGDKLPPNLEWSEMGSYYRAQRAALQAKLDVAVMLEHLWRIAWADREEQIVTKGWNLVEPDEQIRGKFEAYITPDDCLEDWTYTRMYKGKGRRVAYVSSAMEETGLSIGIGVFSKQGQRHLERADLDNQRFEYVRDYDSWWSLASLVPLVREPDLTCVETNAGLLLNALFENFAAS